MNNEAKLIITIDIEEWYHSNWDRLIDKINKETITDLIDNINIIKNILNKYNLNSTMFILSESIRKYPELKDIIIDGDDEIGFHGEEHKGVTELGDKIFNDQIKKGKKELEKNIKRKVIGYRSPNMDINSEGLEIIYKNNFKYDSSIIPSIKIPFWYGNPDFPLRPFPIRFDDGGITEFPISVEPSTRIPGAGGWYLRNIGYNWTITTLSRSLKQEKYAVFYIHPWEFSTNNPKMNKLYFHVFRNTGQYTRNAFSAILKHFKNNVKICTFNDIYEEMGFF